MKVIIILIFFLLIANISFAFTAKCIKVMDGNTIHIWYSSSIFSNRTKLKLHGITCPPKNSPTGSKAKLFLKDKILGKIITINIIDKSFFNGITANVYHKKQCINKVLVQKKLCLEKK